tara:strand:+ start:881 stop:1141 length:261 start_codon:yes stop_codon:yes gene_type:complete
MNFEGKYIDELIDIRKEARHQKDWKLADEIRDYLDTKFTFIFDHKEGQEVFFKKSGSRNKLIKEIEKDRAAEKKFQSWLYTAKQKK